MDLSKAFSKPHVFGMYYLKNKECGGLTSGMHLTTEASDCGTLWFWCLCSHPSQWRPRSKSAPLQGKTGTGLADMAQVLGKASDLLDWHLHVVKETILQISVLPLPRDRKAAAGGRQTSTGMAAVQQPGRHDRQTEIVHGSCSTSSTTPEAAQRLWPRMRRSCWLPDPRHTFWWDQRMPVLWGIGPAQAIHTACRLFSRAI